MYTLLPDNTDYSQASVSLIIEYLNYLNLVNKYVPNKSTVSFLQWMFNYILLL